MNNFFESGCKAVEINLEVAINLFSADLLCNDIRNFAAWNNMGYCKILLAIARRDKTLVEEAIVNLQEAIKFCATDTQGVFYFAEANLLTAKRILEAYSNDV